MANNCYGVCRVVTKNKETLERLEKICNHKDGEFYISRCIQFENCIDADEDDGFWVQDFNVCGCWNCRRFFETNENSNLLWVKDYGKNPDGSIDLNKKIYGTAYLTNLVELAKKLDFGCELFSTETGCRFCEHITVDHNGVYTNEVGEYHLNYPKDENGNPNYDMEPEEDIGIEGFMEFGWASEIYGD